MNIARAFPAHRQPDGRVWFRSGSANQDGWSADPKAAHADYRVVIAPDGSVITWEGDPDQPQNAAQLPAERPSAASAVCVCGPGPVGGAGWRSDCPAHNVRELLKPPPAFDPDTLPDKLADIGLTITEENTVDIGNDFEEAGRTTEWMGYPLPPLVPRAASKFGQWGYYKLPHPETGRPTLFPRATTVAKVLDDVTGLEKWRRRETVGAVVQLLAILEEQGPDAPAGVVPGHTAGELWENLREAYRTATKVNQIDAAVEKLYDMMGGAEAREFGECIHAWLEALAAGIVLLRDVPDMARPHVDAFHRVLARHGLIVVPQYVERTVLNANEELSEHVAGKLDCLLRSVSTGELILGDIKTTKSDSIQYNWITWACQVGGVYGWATHMLDIDGEGWEPMPEVVEDYAVIISVPSDHPENAAALTINKEWGGYRLIESVQLRATRKEAKVEVPKFALPSPTKESLRYVEARQALLAITTADEGQAVYETYQDVWDDDLGEFAGNLAGLL